MKQYDYDVSKIANTAINPIQRDKTPEKVAKDFEAIFANYLVKSMRKTVPDGGFIKKSVGEKMYTEMLDTEYANIMAKNGTLGLSDMILKELQKYGEYSGKNEKQGISISSNVFGNNFVGKSYKNYAPQNYLESKISKYSDIIQQASEKYGVDSSLISAVIGQESAGNQYAISRTGAKGLMQLMDSTAKDMGVKQVYNAKDNIMGGSKYLSMLLNKFNGDEKLALASYNAGPATVEKYNGIPPYKETIKYVDAVLKSRDKFKNVNREN